MTSGGLGVTFNSDVQNTSAAHSAPAHRGRGMTDPRFRPTKVGLIGEQRDSMLQNELHYLPQIGKSKNRGHQLPRADFTYGAAYQKTDGGVQEALQHWINQAKDGKSREERYRMVRDYLSLNKEAVRSGCTNTKQNNHFRSLHDIRRKVKVGGGSGDSPSNNENSTLHRSKIDFPDDMVFGQPHRPSTPIHDVLEHRYLHDWLDAAEQGESMRISSQKEQSKAIAGAYHTKSSWLKNAKIPVDEKPLWKMPRFRGVTATVDSFRSNQARHKAFGLSEPDSIPRQGTNSFSQGVYNVQTTNLPEC